MIQQFKNKNLKNNNNIYNTNKNGRNRQCLNYDSVYFLTQARPESCKTSQIDSKTQKHIFINSERSIGKEKVSSNNNKKDNENIFLHSNSSRNQLLKTSNTNNNNEDKKDKKPIPLISNYMSKAIKTPDVAMRVATAGTTSSTTVYTKKNSPVFSLNSGIINQINENNNENQNMNQTNNNNQIIENNRKNAKKKALQKQLSKISEISNKNKTKQKINQSIHSFNGNNSNSNSNHNQESTNTLDIKNNNNNIAFNNSSKNNIYSNSMNDIIIKTKENNTKTFSKNKSNKNGCRNILLDYDSDDIENNVPDKAITKSITTVGKLVKKYSSALNKKSKEKKNNGSETNTNTNIKPFSPFNKKKKKRIHKFNLAEKHLSILEKKKSFLIASSNSILSLRAGGGVYKNLCSLSNKNQQFNKLIKKDKFLRGLSKEIEEKSIISKNEVIINLTNYFIEEKFEKWIVCYDDDKQKRLQKKQKKKLKLKEKNNFFNKCLKIGKENKKENYMSDLFYKESLRVIDKNKKDLLPSKYISLLKEKYFHIDPTIDLFENIRNAIDGGNSSNNDTRNITDIRRKTFQSKKSKTRSNIVFHSFKSRKNIKKINTNNTNNSAENNDNDIPINNNKSNFKINKMVFQMNSSLNRINSFMFPALKTLSLDKCQTKERKLINKFCFYDIDFYGMQNGESLDKLYNYSLQLFNSTEHKNKASNLKSKDSNNINNKLIKFNLNLNFNNPNHSDNNNNSFQPNKLSSNKIIFKERFKEKNNKYNLENQSNNNLKDFAKNINLIEKKYKDLNMINLLNKNNNIEYKNKYKNIIRNNNHISASDQSNVNSSFTKEPNKNMIKSRNKSKKDSFHKIKNILTYNLLFDPDLLGYNNCMEQKEKKEDGAEKDKILTSMMISTGGIKVGKNMYVMKTMELKSRYDRSKGIKACLFDSIKYCDFNSFREFYYQCKQGPNVRDKDGNTLLSLAVKSFCLDIVNFLLDEKANPNLGNVSFIFLILIFFLFYYILFI